MSSTVHVSNISHSTSEKEVKDFFSFCGKITTISVTPTTKDPNSPQSATVTFEKETAAKTALLLDQTQLGSSHVTVTAAHSLDELAAGHTNTPGSDAQKEEEISQEDLPRSRIVAEYLAHGYVLGDQAIQRAIDLDNKHGISTKFTSALQNFDNKYKATDKARSVDASMGVSNTAGAGWRGLHSYFEKALGTPTGQRVRTFYTQGQRQVVDIHTEARRLADLKKADGTAPGKAADPFSSKPTDPTSAETKTAPDASHSAMEAREKKEAEELKAANLAAPITGTKSG
ncbi:MAG: hypothetical protein M1829_006040 [Trizodia sp. TS-e1964]|nr:MAG: hypothetical protein M1829_006040 [Trizodia sp. TS-e1964]